jgi:hypothetical protein
MKMENDIIIIDEHIEIHPGAREGTYAVVRDGAVYGTYNDLDAARELAWELTSNPTC